MQELKQTKKQKIPLSDYDYQADIRNRIILKGLSQEEISVLEEILFSPVTTPIDHISQNLDIPTHVLTPILDKLLKTELFIIEDQVIRIHKDRRKYFEVQIEKFDPSFKPGMNFLQQLLKNVPIQVLPTWYHIPRSSNHIFNSIIEKYLLTPQLYRRHIKEFISLEETASLIARDIHFSESQTMTGTEIREKYNLTDEEYEELLLELEFNFICLQSFREEGDGYEEIITPIFEWTQYLEASKNLKPEVLDGTDSVKSYRPDEFAFVEEMSSLLKYAEKQSILLEFNQSQDRWVPTPESKAQMQSDKKNHFALDDVYLVRLINKLLLLGLAFIDEDTLKPTPLSKDWLAFPIQKRSHITFKHPHNAPSTEMLGEPFHPHDRRILEIQKSLAKAAYNGWVTFNSFLRGAQIPFSETKRVYLKQSGKNWQYSLPEYTEGEVKFIHNIIFDWLFESGVVKIGHYQEQEVFCLSPLGKALFN